MYDYGESTLQIAVLCLKCVSKEWLNHINNHLFITIHLNKCLDIYSNVAKSIFRSLAFVNS